MDEPGSFDIRQIVKAELWRNFEELEECDLYSSKHCRGKRETSAQLDTLRDTVDDVWTSLKILCETDIEKLGLPYLNSKKQDALKEAIQTRQLDKDFLGRSLRVQWIDYLAEKKRKEQQKLRKLRQQTRQTNSFQTVMVTQQNTCRAMEPGSPLAEDKPEDVSSPITNRILICSFLICIIVETTNCDISALRISNWDTS